jgi:glycolate oxidase
VPSAIEFMERNCLLAAQDYTKLGFPEVRPGTKAHLIIEFDGMDAEAVRAEALRAEALLKAGFASLEYLVSARDEEEKEKIWMLRRSALVAAKARSHCKEEDIVVRRHDLPEAVELLGRMKLKHGLEFIAWGHAGDGNLHVCLMQGNHSRDEFETICGPYLDEFFQEICGRLGGSVTGEHGVGFVQRKYVADSLDPLAIGIMRSIKDLLDPKGILNPGKIFLDAPR